MNEERQLAAKRGGDVAAKGVVVGGMTFASRVGGLLRDAAFSHVLGASVAADTFLLAFRVPNFFRRLCAEGAFSQAFVPVLVGYHSLAERSGDSRPMERFVAAVAGNLGVVMLVACGLGVVGASGVAAVFMVGYLNDPEQFALAVELTRIVFPYAACISFVSLAAGVLNVHHRYAVPAFTPVLLNVALITAALAAATFAADDVTTTAYFLAWGVLAAGVAQLVFQAPSLRRVGMLVVPRPDWRHKGARQVGRLFVPAAFAASAGQINALVGSQIASLLEEGSVAWFYYADRLMELPIGMVAIAIGTVLLPTLSRLHSGGDQSGFNAALEWGVRAGLLIGMPAAAALAILAYPLVATIYLHGETTWSDVPNIVAALRAFAIGLVPLVLVKITAPAYFARHDTKTPFQFGVASVAVNIAVSLATFRWLGHVGLALAVSVSGIVNAAFLVGGLARGGQFRPGVRFLRTTVAAAAATATMSAALWWCVPDTSWWLAASLWMRIWALSAVVLMGLGVFAATALACGVRPRHLLHQA